MKTWIYAAPAVKVFRVKSVAKVTLNLSAGTTFFSALILLLSEQNIDKK